MPRPLPTAGLLLLAFAAGAQPPLVGPEWTVTELDGRPVTSAAPPRLTLTADGSRAGAFGGVNLLGGAYTLDGERLSFGELMGTLMAGPAPLMTQETRFSAALSKVAGFAIADGELRLTAGDTVLMRLRTLIGRDWTLVELEGRRPATLPTPMIRFTPDGKVSGSSAVNRLLGSYTLEGGRLSIPDTASTKVAGPESLIVVELDLLRVLRDVTGYRLVDGQLMLLAGDGVVARFREAFDVTWTVVQLNGKDTVGRRPLTVRLGGDGTLTAFGGVNQLRAEYQLERCRLVVGPLVSTKMAGPPELMRQEAEFAALLAHATAFHLVNDEMALLGGTTEPMAARLRR